MPDEVETIKERLDLAEFIRQYVKLEKAGRNWKARCPFHNEKTPSFMISPEKQVWHCFGCSLGGDIFTFMEEMEGLEFYEALKILADRAGVKLERRSDGSGQARKARFYEVMEWALKFYEKQLHGSAPGKKILEYLSKRGLSEESIEKFRLGYAPDSWNALLNFLKSRGFSETEMKSVGLARWGRDSYYELFRHRLIFPVFDIQGQVIAFGARVLDFLGTKEDSFAKRQPKYINSPETPIYNKSRTLYGLDKSKMNIREKGEALVVEGYTDVILSHQTGVGNVVASSGTALTEKHMNILKRYADKIVLSFDRDEAGGLAQERSIALAQRAGLSVKLLILDEGKDPADIAKEDSQNWKRIAGEGKDIMDFVIAEAGRRFSSVSAEGKKNFAGYTLPFLRRLDNAVERSHWISIIAERLGVSESSLQESLDKLQGEPESVESDENKKSPETKSRSEKMEERLFGFFSLHPELAQGVPDDLFQASNLREGVASIKKNDLTLLANGYYKQLQFVAEEEEKGGMDIKKEVEYLKREIKKIQIREDLNRIATDIKKAEKSNDTENLQFLSAVFRDRANELHDF